jgi:hypothetical protein
MMLAPRHDDLVEALTATETVTVIETASVIGVTIATPTPSSTGAVTGATKIAKECETMTVNVAGAATQAAVVPDVTT